MEDYSRVEYAYGSGAQRCRSVDVSRTEQVFLIQKAKKLFGEKEIQKTVKIRNSIFTERTELK